MGTLGEAYVRLDALGTHAVPEQVDAFVDWLVYHVDRSSWAQIAEYSTRISVPFVYTHISMRLGEWGL